MNSTGLLFISLGIALLPGLVVGVTAALSRRKVSAPWISSLSILGISTPGFLLVMFLWMVYVYFFTGQVCTPYFLWGLVEVCTWSFLHCCWQ